MKPALSAFERGAGHGCLSLPIGDESAARRYRWGCGPSSAFRLLLIAEIHLYVGLGFLKDEVQAFVQNNIEIQEEDFLELCQAKYIHLVHDVFPTRPVSLDCCQVDGWEFCDPGALALQPSPLGLGDLWRHQDDKWDGGVGSCFGVVQELIDQHPDRREVDVVLGVFLAFIFFLGWSEIGGICIFRVRSL